MEFISTIKLEQEKNEMKHAILAKLFVFENDIFLFEKFFSNFITIILYSIPPYISFLFLF